MLGTKVDMYAKSGNRFCEAIVHVKFEIAGECVATHYIFSY
jgi:hypothetical protein